MVKRSTSDRLRLLDEHLRALIVRFYLRPAAAGLTAQLGSGELFALSLLGRRGRCTMSELAQECGLALSSMTGVVDRLAAKGYVKRAKENEEDRRKVFVALAKQGEEVYQAVLESEMEVIIAMMDALRPSEQDILLGALGRAVGALGK